MRKWLWLPAGLLLGAGAVYGGFALFAGQAPSHRYFDAQKCPVEVIAHRGGAALRPENTLAAFEHAAALGADVLEMDLRVTADGEIVVLHDATLDRTTDGSGRVDSMTLEAVRRLDAGYRFAGEGGFPFRGQGIRVPTLEEVLERLPGMRMVLEMKQFTAPQAEKLCALVRRTGMAEKVLVASMPEAPLAAFRAACPEVATSMNASEARYFLVVTSAYTPAAPALQIPDRLGQTVLATPELAATARRRNLKLHVWTVNDERRMRELIEIGVDGIITDRPDRLLPLASVACR
jgi:glycerophosphoryl diester phosphodiesterase